MKNFEYIAEKAKQESPSWSNKQRAAFHYFNPNGKMAAWRKMCDKIDQLVEEGKVKSGWILAYGGLSDFAANSLRDLHGKKRIDSIHLSVALDMLQQATDRGYEKMAEIGE